MAEKDQAVGFFLFQHLRVSFFAHLVVLRVADEHGVAVLLGGILDALKNQRKERIGDVGNGHEQLARLERPQVLGHRVGGVAQALDRLQHAHSRVG